MPTDIMSETLSDLKSAVERADQLSGRGDWPRAKGVLQAWVEITIIRLEVQMELAK